MINETIDIANHYMREHNGELPLMLIVRNSANQSKRIICGNFRPKHYLKDQNTFLRVIRLAMIIDGYDSYSFVMRPEFNKELQLTDNVWAVGAVTEETRTSAFFETSADGDLIPYINETPIGGFMANLLPTPLERKDAPLIPDKVKMQVKGYIENCTYTPKDRIAENDVDIHDVEFTTEDALRSLSEMFSSV